jgi:TP901 family phage tail tape measure protein
MADKQVNWILNIVDNITKPIKQIFESVNGIGVGFSNVENLISSDITSLNNKLSELRKKLDSTILIDERIKLKDEIQKTEKEVEQLNAALAENKTTEFDKSKQSVKGLNTELKKTEENISVFDRIGKNSLNLNQISSSIRDFSDGIVQLTSKPVGFESSMADLQAITGVTGKTFTDIENNARSLAKTFGGDASRSVESYKLVLSKLSPELAKYPDVLDGMARNAMNLSKTMSGDSVAATQVLTSAMNQFGVDLTNPQTALAEMTRQMNIMSASAKEGSAEMPQIKEAIENVGAVAKQAGLSFEETNSAIQLLDKYGKQGAEGGIALRNVLIKLTETPSMSPDILKPLQSAGVDIKKLSDTTIPFTDKMRDLQKVVGNNALMVKMFGAENYLSAIAMINSADAQDELKGKIINTNTTIEQAGIVMNTTAEKTKRWQAVIDDVKISLLNYTKEYIPLTTVLTENITLLSQLAPGINLLSAGFGKMLTPLKNVVTNLLNKLIPGLIGSTTATVGATTATTGATTAQWGFNAAMTANPVGAIALAIVGYGVAIAGIIVYWDELTGWFERQAGWVKILIGLWALLNFPLVALVAITKLLVDNWNDLINFFQRIPKIIDAAIFHIKQRWRGLFADMKIAILDIKEFLLKYHPVAIFLEKMDEMFPFIRERFIRVWTSFYETLIKPIREALAAVFEWTFTAKVEKTVLPPGMEMLNTTADNKNPKDTTINPLNLLGDNKDKTNLLGSGNKDIVKDIQDNKSGGDRILNIDKLVEKIEIHTTNLSESTAKIKDEIIKVVMAAVNDVNSQ